MKRVLLTGFQTFLEHNENPSEVVVREFSPDLNLAAEVHTEIFAVNFNTIAQNYQQILETFQPHLIINVGLAANTPIIRLEKFALNIAFDPETTEPHFVVENNSVAALQSQLPLEQYAQQLCAKGIPTLQSNHAGTYLCNYIFYHSLKWCAQQTPNSDAVFIHIPYTTEMASQICLNNTRVYPSLPQNLIQQAIHELIEAYSTNEISELNT